VTGRDVLRELIPFASTPLAADLKAGIFVARAAGECALACVKVNLEALKDDPRGPELLKQLAPYEERLRRD
jgi:formiminotetrahydrofolate cyclodeaminase